MEFPTHSAETTELAKAMLKVQKQMAPALKDGKNPFTKSNYATLNSVMESCREALLNNNIWLCQYLVPVETPDCIGLMTKLTHSESGQWQSSLAVVPLPKADPQGMGSAITYSRRYSITAMLGMVTEDDDGEAAKLPPKSNTSRSNGNSGASNKQTSSRRHQQADPEFYPDETPFEDKSLPKLDGVNYQYTTTQDGRQCIIAKGNTHPKKEILRGAGFSWDATHKCWWKYADAS